MAPAWAHRAHPAGSIQCSLPYRSPLSGCAEAAARRSVRPGIWDRHQRNPRDPQHGCCYLARRTICGSLWSEQRAVCPGTARKTPRSTIHNLPLSILDRAKAEYYWLPPPFPSKRSSGSSSRESFTRLRFKISPASRPKSLDQTRFAVYTAMRPHSSRRNPILSAISIIRSDRRSWLRLQQNWGCPGRC